jgi:hypothetical protein
VPLGLGQAAPGLVGGIDHEPDSRSGIVGGLIGGLGVAELAPHALQNGVVQPVTAAPARAQEVLTAGRIELRDASGKLRAELAMSADGGPALTAMRRLPSCCENHTRRPKRSIAS